MFKKFKGEKKRIIAVILTMIMAIGMLIGKNLADTNNHYVVDVIKEEAVSQDGNFKITERIVKGSGQQYYDSKKLNYEVLLDNIREDVAVESQIAMLIDTSRSMSTNDASGIAIQTAKSIAESIRDNVLNAYVSISTTDAVKVEMTSNSNASNFNTKVVNKITQANLGTNATNDLNAGLDRAKSTLKTSTDSYENIVVNPYGGNNYIANGYIILFTDSTDNVRQKLQELGSDSNIKVIAVLVDMTSNSFVQDNGHSIGSNVEVFRVFSENEIDQTETEFVKELNETTTGMLMDEINIAINDIELTNVFSNEITEYFTVSNFSVNKGNIEVTHDEDGNINGYKWNIEKIRCNDADMKLTYNIELKTDKGIDAGVVFSEFATNSYENINYTVNNTDTHQLMGTDNREGTEATVIRICQGYDLQIHAFNGENRDLPVNGISLTVIGVDSNGEEIGNITKITDSNGNIKITPDDVRALRVDGKITFTVIPEVNKVGYSSTDTITFALENNRVTRVVNWDDLESGLEHESKPEKRLEIVNMPINTRKVDFEINLQETNNENVKLSNGEFDLIQPKLNNRYEMSLLTGTTDQNGVLHFAPTVMTEDGKYNYILKQNSTQNGYKIAPITLITVKFKNGKIVNDPQIQFNPDATTERISDDHVLINIGNENNLEDPFNLHIDLSDNYGNSLEGATYLVQTTNSNNQVRKEYLTTNAEGKIDTNIYGNGYLIIDITEQYPKVGYAADTQTKELVIQRVNNVVHVITNLQGVNVETGTNNDELIVKLISEKKTEQNVVSLSLYDSVEVDTPVGAGVVYNLVDLEDGTIYGPSVTDRTGNLNFVINTKDQGVHQFKLKVDSSSLPDEYDNQTNSVDIPFALTFDVGGYITDVDVNDLVLGSMGLISSQTSSIVKTDIVEYTASISIGYVLNIGSTAQFKLQLSDYDNMNKKLANASYDINILWEINGNVRTKTITGRKTNSNGELSTNIYKANRIEIEVKETQPPSGYVLDGTVQEIHYGYGSNGAITNIDQTPYDLGVTNTAEPNQGAADVNGNIVYKHLNHKRSAEDTYINLTINKQDLYGNFVGGLKLLIQSDTLVDKNGAPLSLIKDTDLNDGSITIDFEEYLKDTVNQEFIRVTGIGQGESEESVHYITVSELELDSTGTYVEKPGTTVKLRLTFRYREEKVALNVIETIYGNRLVIEKNFSSVSDEKQDMLGIFLTNVNLDLYTDYDDVGNLSLDFKKINQLGDELAGAKYRLELQNPDGRRKIKEFDVKNGETSSDLEIEGLDVSVGSRIYLTELSNPVGYAINENTETLEVVAMGDQGEITLEQKDISYNPNRLQMRELQSSITTAGSIKTNYEVTFIDYHMDTFEFEITTVDSENNVPVPGYEFKIDSSQGATSNLDTNANGSGVAIVGGNIKDDIIEYTVSVRRIAEYYKTLNSTIKVKVAFDSMGMVDILQTQAIQDDPGYGSLWTIEKLAQHGYFGDYGIIGIKILVDHQEKLDIKVQTIDTITNTQISGATYKVTPSNVLSGEGSNNIEVGYVLENGTKTYTIKQTTTPSTYQKVQDKTFTLSYTNEIITNATISSTESKDTIQKTGDREVTIKLYIEPKVPIEIKNLYYFDNTVEIQGSNFEIKSLRNNETVTGTTNANGIVGMYSDILGNDGDQVIYRVRHTSTINKYATVEDFYVKATYNSNREIVSAELVDQYGNNTVDNRFVTVNVKKTSTYSNYNNNDKGIIDIQVLSYPSFKINITDLDRRNGTDGLVGTTYNVKSTYQDSIGNTVNFTSASGVVTNTDGIGIANLDKTRANLIAVYKVTETVPALGYQSFGRDIEIQVTFDGDGYVRSATLVNNQIANVAKVSTISPITRDEDNFEINLELKNNPLLKINITTRDENHSAYKVYYKKETGLSNVELNNRLLSIRNLLKQNNIVDDSEFEDFEIVMADGNSAIWKEKLNASNELVSMSETEQKQWQTRNNIPLNTRQKTNEDGSLAFDTNGNPIMESYPKSAQECYNILKNRYAVTGMNEEDSYAIVRYRYYLSIRNYVTFPMGSFYIQPGDSDNFLNEMRSKEEEYKIKVDYDNALNNVGYQITGSTDGTTYSNSSDTNRANKTGTPQTVYTNSEGLTTAYMDRTLENKEMIYFIDEVKKPAGYDWAEELKLKITYDNDGKIKFDPIVTLGTEFLKVTSWDANEFTVDIEILNREIEEFGISLSVKDAYDPDKNINGIQVNPVILKNEYMDRVDLEKLESGRKDPNNGRYIVGEGCDFKSMGQYITDNHSSAQTVYLVLNINTDGYLEYSKNGKKYDAYYQKPSYACVISVTFDDEGRIVRASPLSGLDNYFGWCIKESGNDTRYLDISYTPGKYVLKVNLRLYPELKLDVKAMDNYTEEVIDANSQGNFTISTQRHLSNTSYDEYVKAGYIGYGHRLSTNTVVNGNIYEGRNTLLVPIEANSTRKYYIFENEEPNRYQKHRPKDINISLYNQRLIAIVEYKFDEYGDMIDYDVRRMASDETVIEPYMNEGNSGYLVADNLKKYNYKEVTDSNTPMTKQIEFDIGYALTTTLKVKAVDDISGNPISNIRMYPFENNTYNTREVYEYEKKNSSWNNEVDYGGQERYRDTNSNGRFDMKYWGSAEADTVKRFIIGSARVNGNYNGYLFPSDMASESLGGSGNPSDYYAVIDVTYDENGRISAVNSVGHDLWGDNNVSDIEWDSDTGEISFNMLYSRKFQLFLNKVDYYDTTTNRLTATFDVISDTGLNTKITSRNMTPFGKVYKDKTVKYSLSEIQAPTGYYPVQGNIDFYVDFDNEGNIDLNSVRSNDSYFEKISTSTTTEAATKTSPDLTINIKDKPAFNLNLKLIDQFYKTEGLSDVYFEITNNKGDSALGNPQTDSNGYVNVITGPIYPGEKVTYYINQVDTVTGYYPNNTTIELEVEFNDVGKVQTYRILNGNNIINNFNQSAYMNTREIDMQIMNMPKDIKFGLYKYDKTTNSSMAGVPFTVTIENVNTGATEQKTGLMTDSNGFIVTEIDTFAPSAAGKSIKYTIHEDETPESYRTIEDVSFIIRYNIDGSIASINQVPNDRGILNTNVVPQAAIGTIRRLNNQRVHLTANVPNDNAFDLIIKNEDTNFADLGVEGSQFDISIAGNTYTRTTDSNGKIKIDDITESGNIIINIAQRTAGEGYRYDVDNNVKINLDKGEQVYSLELNSLTDGYLDQSNAVTTKAIVEVDETYGTVTVTFKNKTKLELTMLKQDINTKATLNNAEFEVTAQQIDSDETPIGNIIVLTEDPEDPSITSMTTGDNGKLYFDLGEAPRSEIWKYTFKEINPPEGYNSIVDLEMKVIFDQYGKVLAQISNQASRLKTYMEHSNNDNCRSMYASIYNGDISPAYTVKVVTEDADTGKRISGSEVFVNVTDQNGDLITVLPKTQSSMQNGGRGVTGNLGIDGNLYTDDQVTNGEAPIIMERGIAYLDNIDYEGIINIEISQEKTAPGYIFTDLVTGNVKLETTYIPHLNEDPTLGITVLENSGFRVVENETEKTITITILNESQVTFEIATQEYRSTPDTEITPIPGVSYTIVSEIQTAVDSIPTDLNAVTPMSNEEGKSEENVGKAYAGKTVVYTLHQAVPSGYKEIDDIQVEVQYNSRGYIIHTELLSSEENCYIDREKTEGRTISIVVQNRRVLAGYKVQLEKHAMDTDSDLEAYGRVLEGGKYQITVEQQYNGSKHTEWTDITDENGLIKSPYTFNGYGYITVTIEELEAPEGYEKHNTIYFEIYRHPDTGEIEKVDGNINIEEEDITIDEEGNIIFEVKPLDNQKLDKFTLILNKVSEDDSRFIVNNPAKFRAQLVQYDQDGNIAYYDDLANGVAHTGPTGSLVLDKLQIPENEGNYCLVITEFEAPEGYIKIEDPITIPVRFERDSLGNISVKHVDDTQTDIAKISKVYPQLIGLNIMNEKAEVINNEYALDITKVDAETNDPIEATSIFKVLLPDANQTYVYTETMENQYGVGKLDYCYIEQDKDYDVRLTHMKLPDAPATLQYVFEEIVPPEGYEKIGDRLTLQIEFAENEETGELYIKNMTSSDPNHLRINTQTPCGIDEMLSIDILNNKAADHSEFTIQYNGNADDATEIPEAQIKNENVILTLTTATPLRQGYVFKGWSMLPEGNVQFNPGDDFVLNQDIMLYAVWEKGLYIKSTEYLIGNGINYPEDWSPGDLSEYEDGDLYIKGIRPQVGPDTFVRRKPENAGTYMEEFLSKIETNADKIEIYKPTLDTDGNRIITADGEVTENVLIGTGMMVKFIKGNEEIVLTAIVRGDFLYGTTTTGDGKLDGADVAKAKILNSRRVRTDLTEEERQALDYYLNTNQAWSTNRMGIRETYTTRTLKDMR